MQTPLAPTAVDYLLDDTSGDIVVVEGRPMFSEGLVAIAQGIRVRFSIWKGEWFYEPGEGLPVMGGLLARGIPISDLRSVFDRALVRCPGVASRESLTVQRIGDVRELVVAFSVRTVAGAILNSSDFAPFVVSI